MIDNKVRSVVRALSETRGKDFFNTIVQALANVIDADFTFVAELDSGYTTATTVALSAEGAIADNFSYDLRGTPCANVAENNVCIHTSGIQPIYPDDQLLVDMGIHAYVGTPLFDRTGKVIGILVALYREPIVNSNSIEALFLLFAGLIGGELEKIAQTEQLRLAQRALDTTQDMVMICDINSSILYVNAAFLECSGYQAEEAIGCTPVLMKSGLHDEAFYQDMWDSIHAKGTWAGEIWNRKKDGSLSPQWLTISAVEDEKGKVSHYTGISHDISDQKAIEEKILFQATHDLLTKLPNRNLFTEHLTQAISLAERQNSRFAVMLLDLDLFKMINDTLGHSVGDLLLSQVAMRLQQVVRESDMVARIGDDEFVLLLRDVQSVEQVSGLANKLLTQLREPFLLEGRPCEVTISIGITLYPEDSGLPDELVAHADQAMYNTKRRGRDGYSFFNQEMQVESDRRLQLKEQLREAIDSHAFTLNYQPIIDLQSGEVTKCEALARWCNTEGDWVPPDQFIPVAEEFGYMTMVGEQVLEMACRDLQLLRGEGFDSFTIAVNRSVQEFPRSAKLVIEWLKTMENYQLPGDAIVFEITESLLAPENDVYLGALELLQQAGAQISIDDFGTGYSSLSYLQRFPVDVLKIDRAFISRLSNKPKDNMLVASIIAMGNTMGMKVVAEGIETEEQYRILTDMGCDYGQGYYIARPMPFEALKSYLNPALAKEN